MPADRSPPGRSGSILRSLVGLGVGAARTARDRFDHRSQVPRTIDELDAPYLSGLLRSPVTSVEVLETSSGTTDRARLRLHGDRVPASIFVKIAPTKTGRSEHSRTWPTLAAPNAASTAISVPASTSRRRRSLASILERHLAVADELDAGPHAVPHGDPHPATSTSTVTVEDCSTGRCCGEATGYAISPTSSCSASSPRCGSATHRRVARPLLRCPA